MQTIGKVTLLDWHKQWVKKPFVIIMLIAFIAATCLAVLSYFKKIETFEKSLDLGTQLIATSLYNKDRKSTELILNNLIVLNNFEWVSVCQKSQSILFLSHGEDYENSCSSETAFLVNVGRLISKIPGYADGYLVVKIKFFDLLYPLIIAFLILIIIALFLRMFSQKIYHRINIDLIDPIHQFALVTSHQKSHLIEHKIDEIATVHKKLIASHHMGIEYSNSQVLNALAKQVAHDIRSPLSVLNMLIPSMNTADNSEKCELLLHAAQRIDKIAEDLLNKGKNFDSDNLVTSLDIEKLVIEKQMLLASQSKNIRIEFNASLFSQFKSKISKIDLERIVSNLLNNAIEALIEKDNGIVQLTLSSIDNSTVLAISDNGKGIEPANLAKIGIKGFTSGKASGSGLGTHHAKSTIEAAGGSFNIASQLGLGTTVTISI